MAQTSLPAPRPVRRRALGGLVDADGWPWAFINALAWFVLIILLLGYLPDRAYYFTVQRTVDIGLLAWSPINFCPPENETLPCPAPAGATLPWHTAPVEVHLPAAREDGAGAVLGTTYLYAGGTDGSAPVKDVYFSQAVGSTVFVIGGYGPDGKPTSTVYSLTRGQDGTLPTEWTVVDAAALPEPRAGAVAVAVSDGLVLVGGTDGTAAKNTVWKTKTDTSGAPGAWTAQSPLFEAVVDATAVHVGDVVFVMGGSDDKDEPVATVQQGLVGGPEAPADDPNAIVALWRV